MEDAIASLVEANPELANHPMNSEELTTLYVPIVHVIVSPTQNKNKPAIEKTDRMATCPVYMVKLFKRQWGHTAAVHVKRILDKNDLWKVPQMPGRSIIASEIERCQRFFPKGLFDSVYPDHDEFAAAFAKVATTENKHLIDQEARDDENRDAALALASKGLMRSATEAAVQVRRKTAKRMPTTTVHVSPPEIDE